MINFGHFYLNGRLTVYDVAVEVRQGRRVYVVSLSEDPGISFVSVRAENAIFQLKDYLERVTRAPQQPAVTWLPQGAHTRV